MTSSSTLFKVLHKSPLLHMDISPLHLYSEKSGYYRKYHFHKHKSLKRLLTLRPSPRSCWDLPKPTSSFCPCRNLYRRCSTWPPACSPTLLIRCNCLRAWHDRYFLRNHWAWWACPFVNCPVTHDYYLDSADWILSMCLETIAVGDDCSPVDAMRLVIGVSVHSCCCFSWTAWAGLDCRWVRFGCKKSKQLNASIGCWLFYSEVFICFKSSIANVVLKTSSGLSWFPQNTFVVLLRLATLQHYSTQNCGVRDMKWQNPLGDDNYAVYSATNPLIVKIL